MSVDFCYCQLLEDFQSFLPGWKSEKRNEATTWPQLENEIIKYQVADYDYDGVDDDYVEAFISSLSHSWMDGWDDG